MNNSFYDHLKVLHIKRHYQNENPLYSCLEKDNLIRDLENEEKSQEEESVSLSVSKDMGKRITLL